MARSSQSSFLERYRNAALTNTSILVRSGPCEIFGWTVNNPNTSEIFVQLHDARALLDITLGTTICDLPLKVPAQSTVMIVPNENTYWFFTKGLVVAATTTENGASAPGLPVSVVIGYR